MTSISIVLTKTLKHNQRRESKREWRGIVQYALEKWVGLSRKQLQLVTCHWRCLEFWTTWWGCQRQREREREIVKIKKGSNFAIDLQSPWRWLRLVYYIITLYYYYYLLICVAYCCFWGVVHLICTKPD